MKLVRQAALAFQGGASDKLYQVDLLEVGPDRFVVNFRYGRRGSTLKEGTKTTAPLSRAEAEKVFERLVASKKAEGYLDAGSAPSAPVAPSAPAAPPPPAAQLPSREQFILDVLSGARKSNENDKDRALWRVVELDLAAAEPYLKRFVGSGSDLRQYMVAAALGRCASDSAFEELRGIFARSKSEMVKRMALEGQRAIAVAKSGLAREAFFDRAREELPPAFQQPARESAAAFARALDAFLASKDPRTGQILAAVYRLDSPNTRPALLAAARSMPLDAVGRKALRYLYKLAEYRRDAQLFGILAHRIEKLRTRRLPGRNPMTGEVMTELARDGASGETKRYLRRRTWRTLRRLALDGRGDLYVRMATGVLAAFTDEDAEKPRRFTKWPRRAWMAGTTKVRARGQQERHSDRFASYWAFNKILYGRSSRYYAARTEVFHCAEGYKPGDPAPVWREESFPEHWDRSPEALLHLLSESACLEVHRFGLKVLAASPDLDEWLDGEGAACLLLARYEETTRFGLEKTLRKWPQDAPDEVLAALASSDLEPARQEAWRRLDAFAERVLGSTALVAELIRARHADSRARVRDFLGAHPLAGDAAKVVVGRLIALLRAEPPRDEALAIDVVRTLGACFPRELQAIDRLVIGELLSAGSTPLLVLAAEILLARQAAGEFVDGATITKLIKSEHEALRSVGVRMLGNLPLDVLRENEDVLVTLATTDLADLRAAVRPIAKKIADRFPEFAAKLADVLVKKLLVRKQPEGMHEHLLKMLREDLASVLERLPKELVQQLLRAPVSQAQELGGVLLAKNVRADELSVAEIMKLASHDVRLVRETAWRFFEESLPRVRADLRAAVAVLDARWQDSREWARRLFTEKLLQELDPELLVAICDSVRPDVQQFGRELITKRFEEPQGWEYLSKLSEHPTTELQLFASNFLERHAAGSLERLRALVPYFVSVLSRVNKGRVAKDRALAFLLAEGLKSEDAARVVASIFARQAVTIAITDKAALISGLLAIKKAYPAVEMPLVVQTIEVRHGV